MTRPDDHSAPLGDILGTWNEDGTPASKPATPRTRYSFDDILVQLAKAWGEDHAEVLREFHGDTALARLARKILATDTKKESAAMRTYLLGESIRREGYKGVALFAELARRLWESQGRNVSGPAGTEDDSSSAKTQYYRGKRELEERAQAFGTLKEMFSPDDG